MAKRLLVTLPYALLLLDFWPLRRFQVASNGSAPVSPWLRLVREKAPFFLLAAGACILTVVAQARGGSVSSLQQWPVGARFANALEAYLSYLEKLAWPSGMSVIYPLASSYLFGKIALAVLLLAILSAAAIVGRASRPYGLMGWLWFLGTLVPVIGILQVGAQNMADRYTYIPSIGLFIAVCWGAHDASRKWRYGGPAVIVVAMATLLALAANTRVQLNYWRNSDTLLRHALAIDPGNVIAHRTYGAYLRDAGRLEESRMQCQRVVEIASTYAMGYTFLARTLMLENKQDDAIATLRTGLKFKPGMTVARCDLAAALFSTGRWREAETELETGLAYDATDPDLHCLLAMDTAMQGHFLRAEQQCAEALRLAPAFPAVHVELAQILAAQRKTAGAIAEYRRALELQPDLPAALNELAWILATSADPKFRNGAEAASMATRACELTRNREALGTLAAACAEAGRFDQAASLAQRAHDVAVANGDTNAALRNLELKKTYQARQPFYNRDPSPPFRGTCPPSVHAIR